MKANEFVKKFGWFAAERYLAGHTIMDNHLMVFTNADDLKRIVNSYELVESYGGLEQCKNLLVYCPPPLQVEYSDLKQAIVDVEGCK